MAKNQNTEQTKAQTQKLSPFEAAIKAHLDKRAAEDELFAKSYAKENKSIKECCRYLVGEEYDRCKSATSIMDDATTYGLAVHYYDEDDIEIKSLPRGAQYGVSAPHNGATYNPTEEDKAAAKQAAIRRLEEEAYQKLHAPKKRKTEAVEQPANAGTQTSLFDLLQ